MLFPFSFTSLLAFNLSVWSRYRAYRGARANAQNWQIWEMNERVRIANQATRRRRLKYQADAALLALDVGLDLS